MPRLEGGLAGWLRPFQRRLVPRALGLGLVSALVAGSAAVGVLASLGVDALAFEPFLGWKALYAGVLAAGMQPAIALLALADPPRA